MAPLRAFPGRRLFKRDPSLNLTQLRQILTPGIELGRSRIGVIRYVLSRFERTSVSARRCSTKSLDQWKNLTISKTAPQARFSRG